jgi:hypothetical protein
MTQTRTREDPLQVCQSLFQLGLLLVLVLLHTNLQQLLIDVLEFFIRLDLQFPEKIDKRGELSARCIP